MLGEAGVIWEEIGERRHLAFCQMGLAKAVLARRDVRTRGHDVQCVHLLAATYGQVKGRFFRLWTGIAEQRLGTALGASTPRGGRAMQ